MALALNDLGKLNVNSDTGAAAIAANLYTMAGTPNGAQILDLVYLV